jgi:hypothetical protein
LEVFGRQRLQFLTCTLARINVRPKPPEINLQLLLLGANDV